MLRKALYFIVLLLCLGIHQHSSAKTEDKAVFIINLTKSKYIAWPEVDSDTFQIAVINNVELFTEIQKRLNRKISFRRTPINCQHYMTVDQAPESHLMYIHQRDSKALPDYLKAHANKPILVVGERFNFHTCMINLLELDGELSFEINDKLIEQRNLSVQPALLKLGAKSGDEWSALLDIAKDELESERESLEQQERNLKRALANLNKHKLEIMDKDAALSEASAQLDETAEDLGEAKAELSDQEELLRLQQQDIEAQKKAQRDLMIIIGLSSIILIFIIFSLIKNRQANKRLNELNKAILEQKREITVQKQRVESSNLEMIDSINYAQHIQQAILPSQKDIAKVFQESFVIYLPKDIVSGDFYWMHDHKDHVHLAVADCTGHGVPGALVSMVCSRLLLTAVADLGLTKPSTILDTVNTLLQDALQKDGKQLNDGMDISLIQLEKNTNRLTFAGANNPLYWIRNEQLQEIKGDKQPIGKFVDTKPFTDHVVELASGDQVYLFTDGFADQFGGPKGKKLKYKRLKEELTSGAASPMQQQGTKMHEVFTDWKSDYDQIDDVCLVGIRV